MAEHQDYPKTRVFVPHALASATMITLGEQEAHYLRDVLRMKSGDLIAVFNGKDGEWKASISDLKKKEATLACETLLREQMNNPDAWLLAAPLKAGRHEDVAVKATELGISAFIPVFTTHSVVDKVNNQRIKKLLQEAAEQCERMDVPELHEAQKLDAILSGWPVERILFYADESGGSDSFGALGNQAVAKWAVLIGPEGGFSTDELRLLKSLPFARGISLGPRILKADTAALCALSCLMARFGDWQHKPAFRSQS